jgi:hypothetical protein
VIMSIFIIGDQEVAESFTRMGIRAQDVEPAMIEIGQQLQKIADISMTAQGRRGGGSWAFLKPDTIRRKAKKGLDPRIEFATHALYNSLTKVAAGSHIDTDHNSVRFGSDLAYARAQHFGRPEINLPARPLITIVEGDRKMMAKTILDHIVG